MLLFCIPGGRAWSWPICKQQEEVKEEVATPFFTQAAKGGHLSLSS
jgi:hypothetical protein